MTTRQTQLDAVKAALLARETVNQVEAIRRGWGLRLGSIIHRLRGRGWPVRAVRQHGNGLALYSLPDDWTPPTAHGQGSNRKALADLGNGATDHARQGRFPKTLSAERFGTATDRTRQGGAA